MVYKLRFDRNNFMEFDLSPTEIETKLGDMFALDTAEKWASIWKPLEGSFFDDSDKQTVIALPDISLWANNEIVCNEKAYAVLKVELSPFGEWLPISIEGISYWLFHVTNRTSIDFVNVKESARTIDEVDYIEIEKLSFNEDMLNNMLVFKTEYNNYKNIYCTDSFKSLIEKNKLKGLIFSEDMSNSPF